MIAQAVSGQPNRFITITCKRGLHPTAAEAAAALANAWRLVVKRWRRAHPKQSLEYVAVFEATKTGWPHLHILARSGWIDQRWLSGVMASILKSPVVWVESLKQHLSAAAYVGKYCGKAPHRFGKSKRYWMTPKYKDVSRTDARKDFLFKTAWYINPETVNELWYIWRNTGRHPTVHRDWSISWGRAPP